MISEVIDSYSFSDSLLGQLAKGIVKKTLSNYIGTEALENLEEPIISSSISKLSRKWSRQIMRDLSKIEITQNEKKVILALALASIYTRLFSDESSQE